MRRLTVLTGPTAVGKGTVNACVRKYHPEVWFSVSATTRPARAGEVDGKDYFFVSNGRFDELIAQNQLLEYAVVHGTHRYGTPRKPVEDALAAGAAPLLEIDLQGARQVRQAMPDARLVFLAPPSWEELVSRLTGRGTENAEEQQRRLETAQVELASQREFDHVIINRDVRGAAEELVQLMELYETG